MPAGFRPAAERRAGISLKPEHYREILDTSPDVGWFEVHPENYMVAGGPPLRWLEAIRERWPLSLHGVGMSLGSPGRPPDGHLRALKRLIDRFEPFLVSEHLSWSRTGGVFLADLLPLPMTRETLDAVAANVGHVQDVLGRQLLIENPSAYLALAADEMPETEFLRQLAARTGCGLLLDINNVFVAARNQGFDARDYLDAYPVAAVGEIHLAGHAIERRDGLEIRIDDHGSPVPAAVWKLYDETAPRCAGAPVLIERDDNIPALAELLAEAARAEPPAASAEIPAAPSVAVSTAPSAAASASQSGDGTTAPASQSGDRTAALHLAGFQDAFRRAMGGADTGPSANADTDSHLDRDTDRDADAERTGPKARARADAALMPALSRTGGMSRHVRLDVYRNNIASALVRSLRGLYPALLSLAGEEFFDAMAQDYARRNPPAHGVLAEYGHDFPEFVAAFAPAAGWPYFADSARLDLAWFRAYAAAEAASCDPARLACIAPEDLPEIHLGLHPSHTLLRSPWPLDRIREAALEDGADGAGVNGSGSSGSADGVDRADADGHGTVDVGDRPAFLLVVRPQTEVEIRTLTEGGFAFLETLAGGAALAKAAEAAAARDAAFDAAAHLAGHLEGGTFSSCTLRGEAV